jgi:hypothetical protein
MPSEAFHTGQVRNLLDSLRQLRLIEWTRGRYYNTYRVLDPDRQKIADRKEEASSKEALKRGPQPPTPSPKGRGAERARPPEKAPPAGTEPNTKTVGSKKSFADDESQRTLSPEDEFRRRLAERNHGPLFDVDGCIANVRRQLEKCGGLSVADFVAHDRAKTTGKHLTNPSGYYVLLAKELVRATNKGLRDAMTEPLRRAAEAAPSEPPRDTKGRCAKCGGPGLFPDGRFCGCQTGRDLERLSRRKPKNEVEPQPEKKGAA